MQQYKIESQCLHVDGQTFGNERIWNRQIKLIEINKWSVEWKKLSISKNKDSRLHEA